MAIKTTRINGIQYSKDIIKELRAIVGLAEYDCSPSNKYREMLPCCTRLIKFSREMHSVRREGPTVMDLIGIETPTTIVKLNELESANIENATGLYLFVDTKGVIRLDKKDLFNGK